MLLVVKETVGVMTGMASGLIKAVVPDLSSEAEVVVTIAHTIAIDTLTIEMAMVAI
jgi:hypothetical protein